MADDRGRPVAFALTPGNVADITMAMSLLASVEQPKRVIADKAYDVNSLRRWLKARRVEAVIPSTATGPCLILSTDQPIGAATSSSACSVA